MSDATIEIHPQPAPTIQVRNLPPERIVTTRPSSPSTITYTHGETRVVRVVTATAPVVVRQTEQPTVSVALNSAPTITVTQGGGIGGESGTSDQIPFTGRSTTDYDVMYVGYAQPADAGPTEAKHKIYRINVRTGLKLWADGNQFYDNVWDTSGGSGLPTYETLTYA